jgi:hypothetical protein
MQEMSVAATVPGGNMMTVNVNGQEMGVQVPPGIQPGQNFTFKAPMPQMAQPMMAQPVMAQPAMASAGSMIGTVQPSLVVGQPVQGIAPTQPTVIIQQGVVPGQGVPPGAPEGGNWVMQSYCGDTTCMATILVAVFFWPATCCVPCCKCDQRQVYVACVLRLSLPSPASPSLVSHAYTRTRPRPAFAHLPQTRWSTVLAERRSRTSRRLPVLNSLCACPCHRWACSQRVLAPFLSFQWPDTRHTWTTP